MQELTFYGNGEHHYIWKQGSWCLRGLVVAMTNYYFGIIAESYSTVEYNSQGQ